MLSKMTEEERILYLEQQRLAEEEMRKNKEDMLTQFLKVCKSSVLRTIICMILLFSSSFPASTRYMTKQANKVYT